MSHLHSRRRKFLPGLLVDLVAGVSRPSYLEGQGDSIRTCVLGFGVLGRGDLESGVIRGIVGIPTTQHFVFLVQAGLGSQQLGGCRGTRVSRPVIKICCPDVL